MICPICKTRKLIRATCGSPDCQYQNHLVKSKEWWGRNKHYYRKGVKGESKKNLCGGKV